MPSMSKIVLGVCAVEALTTQNVADDLVNAAAELAAEEEITSMVEDSTWGEAKYSGVTVDIETMFNLMHITEDSEICKDLVHTFAKTQDSLFKGTAELAEFNSWTTENFAGKTGQQYQQFLIDTRPTENWGEVPVLVQNIEEAGQLVEEKLKEALSIHKRAVRRAKTDAQTATENQVRCMIQGMELVQTNIFASMPDSGAKSLYARRFAEIQSASNLLN